MNNEIEFQLSSIFFFALSLLENVVNGDCTSADHAIRAGSSRYEGSERACVGAWVRAWLTPFCCSHACHSAVRSVDDAQAQVGRGRRCRARDAEAGAQVRSQCAGLNQGMAVGAMEKGERGLPTLKCDSSFLSIVCDRVSQTRSCARRWRGKKPE